MVIFDKALYPLKILLCSKYDHFWHAFESVVRAIYWFLAVNSRHGSLYIDRGLGYWYRTTRLVRFMILLPLVSILEDTWPIAAARLVMTIYRDLADLSAPSKANSYYALSTILVRCKSGPLINQLMKYSAMRNWDVGFRRSDGIFPCPVLGRGFRCELKSLRYITVQCSIFILM